MYRKQNICLRKKNAWRMLIPFISHNLWFYFLPPLWFGSSARWQDTWFEYQLLRSVSYLHRKVQIEIHESISTCVMCERETCPFTMGKEHRLRVVKGRLFEKIWMSKRGSSNWRTWHAEELHFWYFSTYNWHIIIKAIRSAQWNGLEM
jgi:hypothetical protein